MLVTTESLYTADIYGIVYTHYTTQVNTMPKLLHTRHFEYLLMSIVTPIAVLIMIYGLEQVIHLSPAPPESTTRMIYAALGVTLFLWLTLTLAAVAQTPGYGRYAWYILALPVGSLFINYYFEVGRIDGLHTFGIALVATWLGSLAFCAVDWYNVNHQHTLELTQKRLR